MLDVATTAYIDSDAAGTRLIPQQSILVTDHVALVVGEQVNHLITRGEPAARFTHRGEFIDRFLLSGRHGHKGGITCPPESVKTPR